MAKKKSGEIEGRDEALKALGQQIRAVRQSRDISQEDFAARWHRALLLRRHRARREQCGRTQSNADCVGTGC